MGVSTVVVRDVVTSNGALVEKTTDWYAQQRNGDVWYFGEATAEYENGKIATLPPGSPPWTGPARCGGPRTPAPGTLVQ
jgi:hypothetical protein